MNPLEVISYVRETLLSWHGTSRQASAAAAAAAWASARIPSRDSIRYLLQRLAAQCDTVKLSPDRPIDGRAADRLALIAGKRPNSTTSISCGFVVQHAVQQAVQQVHKKIESLQEIHTILALRCCTACCKACYSTSPLKIVVVEFIQVSVSVGLLVLTIRYDIFFALENWQASCQFNLAHELKEN